METDWEAEYHKLVTQFVEKQGEMHGQMSRLRKENAELRARIAATPAYLTELQDQVSLLESLTFRRVASGATQYSGSTNGEG